MLVVNDLLLTSLTMMDRSTEEQKKKQKEKQQKEKEQGTGK